MELHVPLILLFFIPLLRVANGQYVDHPGDCDSQNVERCASGVKDMYGMQDMLANNNPEELQELCRYTQEAMNCINVYVVRCLDSTHRNLYRDMTAGLQDFINEFCDENSEFSKEYRRHLTCYNNLTAKYQECADIIVKAEELVGSSKKFTIKEALKIICCNYYRSVDCYHRVTLDHCSREAANFADVIFHKILANNTRLLQCDKHKSHDPSCKTINTAFSYKSNAAVAKNSNLMAALISAFIYFAISRFIYISRNL